MQKEIEELKELVAKQAALLAVANSPDNFGKENNASSSTDSKPKDQRIDDILVSGEQLAFLFDQLSLSSCGSCPETQAHSSRAGTFRDITIYVPFLILVKHVIRPLLKTQYLDGELSLYQLDVTPKILPWYSTCRKHT